MSAYNVTTTVYQQENKSQGLLYLPSIGIALFLIVLLAISFYRYHRKAAEKRRHMKDYAMENLNVKRGRIRGYISGNTCNSQCRNSVFTLCDGARNDSLHLTRLTELPPLRQHRPFNDTYDNKLPHPAANYYGNCNRSALTDNQYQSLHNKVLPLSSYDPKGKAHKLERPQNQDSVEILKRDIVDENKHKVDSVIPTVSNRNNYVDYGIENMAYYSEGEALSKKKKTIHNIDDEMPVDAFHDPVARRHSRKKKKKQTNEERNLPMDLFPRINIRMGAIYRD